MSYHLSRLEINNFRNLTSIQIEPIRECNFFYGKNGSGKTSLLEAIYHLSIARSFRTHLYSRVIQENKNKFSVCGQIGGEVPVGVERHRSGELNIRFAREDVASISNLANFLPMQVIDPYSHQLISAGPQIRRQFIDWGVFHVEHNHFLKNWREFQKIIKQRNAALKQKSKEEAFLWDIELVKTADLIDSMRTKYFEQYQSIFFNIAQDFLDINDLSMHYQAGWDKEIGLEQQLKNSINQDKKMGYTHYGPHRANLKIMIGNSPAADILSRGQQKMLASTMKIVQASLLKSSKGKNSLFLVDDLPSELDADKRASLAAILFQMDAQLFVTGIEKNGLISLFNQGNSKMFHVEHGTIKEEKV